MDQITVLILTYNEAPNIERTLDRLRWARTVLVVDSFSSDDTVAIARRFPNVCVLERSFDSFAGQCNLLDEIADLPASPAADGYSVQFRYCIWGKPLRKSLYPARTVLYRKDKAHYRDDGHGHRVVVSGETKTLSGWIDHDDRKTFDRWLGGQARYSLAETRKLLETSPSHLNLADRLRLWIVPAPFMVFFYTLLVKGLIFDGWRGWYYVLQRTFAEILLSLRLIEAKLSPEA